MSTPANSESQTRTDHRFMMAAIRYARKHAGLTGTNPAVACLIVKEGDEASGLSGKWICGRGVTAIGGRPHAEASALQEAAENAKGATAYVTLEPCAHHGLTPPCAQTLIDAGVARVVTAQLDPDSRVNSLGHQMLLDAGINVAEFSSPVEKGSDETSPTVEAAKWSLRGYLSRKTRKRPWVTLKLAITSDGYLGLRGSGQVSITGPVTNAQTHLMRARYDAILVGSGTAIADDPSLTCRLNGLDDRSPIRIVLENSTAIAPDCKLLETATHVTTYLACPQSKLKERKHDLQDCACKFLACDMVDGKIALPELLADLSDIGISTLMVEGGKEIAKSFLNADLIDEIILYVGREKMADKEQAKTNAAWISWPTLPDAIPDGFRVESHWQYGTDKAIRMVRAQTY